jgi:hypothetical protein
MNDLHEDGLLHLSLLIQVLQAMGLPESCSAPIQVYPIQVLQALGLPDQLWDFQVILKLAVAANTSVQAS